MPPGAEALTNAGGSPSRWWVPGGRGASTTEDVTWEPSASCQGLESSGIVWCSGLVAPGAWERLTGGPCPTPREAQGVGYSSFMGRDELGPFSLSLAVCSGEVPLFKKRVGRSRRGAVVNKSD